MDHNTELWIRRCEYIMIMINLVALLFHIMILVSGTKYIVISGFSYTLLSRLDAIPKSPIVMMFKAVILYALLLALMHIHGNYSAGRPHDMMFLAAELIVVYALILTINDSYNGFILLVIADMLRHTDNRKHAIIGAVICSALWLYTQNGFMDVINHIPSINDYIALFSAGRRIAVLFIKNLLTSINIITFFALLFNIIVYERMLLNQAEEDIRIAVKVNADLQHYVQLIEKIAEDNERKRIARELHDTIGHVLTGISAGLEAGMLLLDIDRERGMTQLGKVQNALREGTTDVRRSLKRLRPKALEQKSFIKAVSDMIDEYHELTALNINFHQEWESVQLEDYVESAIYRAIQESVTNSLRHGHADRVEVNLLLSDDEYIIIIQDNGIGFDELHMGYGLTQMKERFAQCGGIVQFMNEGGFRTFIGIPRKQGERSVDI